MAEIEGSGRGKRQKGSLKSKRRTSTRVDMTPMVDLAFLLITFFMLTTTFIKLRTIEMEKEPLVPPDLKELKQDQLDDDKSFTIYVWDKNQIFWSKDFDSKTVITTSYGAEGLRKIFEERKLATKNEYVTLIKMHPNATAANLVKVLDEYNIAKPKRSYFITDARKSEFDRVNNTLNP